MQEFVYLAAKATKSTLWIGKKAPYEYFCEVVE